MAKAKLHARAIRPQGAVARGAHGHLALEDAQRADAVADLQRHAPADHPLPPERRRSSRRTSTRPTRWSPPSGRSSWTRRSTRATARPTPGPARACGRTWTRPRSLAFLAAYATHPNATSAKAAVLSDFIAKMLDIGKLKTMERRAARLAATALASPTPSPAASSRVAANAQDRRPTPGAKDPGMFAIGVLTDPKDEGIDLDDDAWRDALARTRAAWKPDPARGRVNLPTSPSGKGIREARDRLGGDADRGLLLLYPLTPYKGKAKAPENLIVPGWDKPIMAFAIAFPSSRDTASAWNTKSTSSTGCRNMARPSNEFLHGLVVAHQRRRRARLAGHRPALRRAASAAGRPALAGQRRGGAGVLSQREARRRRQAARGPGLRRRARGPRRQRQALARADAQVGTAARSSSRPWRAMSSALWTTRSRPAPTKPSSCASSSAASALGRSSCARERRR